MIYAVGPLKRIENQEFEPCIISVELMHVLVAGCVEKRGKVVESF